MSFLNMQLAKYMSSQLLRVRKKIKNMSFSNMQLIKN